MKNRTWHRFLAFVLSLVLLTSALSISSYAYYLPSGYTLSKSYQSGKYYTQLKAVVLTGDQRSDLVAIAKSQLGYHEGPKGVFSGYGTGTGNYTEYNRYAYTSDNVAWCASFVAWCAAMAGIPTSILPKTAAANPKAWKMCGPNTIAGSSAKTPYDLPINGGSYIPKVGDIAFFGSKPSKKAENNICSHIGIITDVKVTYSSSGSVKEIRLTTIEGNYSSKVSQNTYVFNSSNKYGLAYGSTYLNTFGVPNYKSNSTADQYPSLDMGSYGGTYLRTTTPVCDAVRVLQQALNIVSLLDKNLSLSTLSVDGEFGSSTASAVKKYQSYKGFDADGIVGSTTWNALRNDLKALTGAYKNDYILSGTKLYAYKGNDKSVTIPEGITDIREDAFRYRSSITSVKLPATVTKVRNGAFKGCSSLSVVSYEGSSIGFSDIAMSGGNDILVTAPTTFSDVVVTFVTATSEKKVTIKKGTSPLIPEDLKLEKPSDALASYVFVSWTKNGAPVSSFGLIEEDCTFVAQYEKTEKQFNVQTLNDLLVALSEGTGDTDTYDFNNDGVLNVADLNALLVILSQS